MQARYHSQVQHFSQFLQLPYTDVAWSEQPLKQQLGGGGGGGGGRNPYSQLDMCEIRS